eukprot:scaffold149049_cov14-Tisochrysis_lutea.AAC.1
MDFATQGWMLKRAVTDGCKTSQKSVWQCSMHGRKTVFSAHQLQERKGKGREQQVTHEIRNIIVPRAQRKGHNAAVT